MKSMGYVISVYWMNVNGNPNVGDLLITLYDTNNNIVATLSCQKDWVNGLDLNDTKKNREILQKVIATAITNKPITAPSSNTILE